MKQLLLNLTKRKTNEALARGAKKDVKNDLIYIDPEDVDKFIDLIGYETIYCDTLYLFEAERKCWSCGEMTKQYLLASNKNVDIYDGLITFEDLQFFTYMTKAPKALIDILRKKCQIRFFKDS